jgi:hypothetical protein
MDSIVASMALALAAFALKGHMGIRASKNYGGVKK